MQSLRLLRVNLRPNTQKCVRRTYLIAGKALELSTTIIGKPDYDGFKTERLADRAAKSLSRKIGETFNDHPPKGAEKLQEYGTNTGVGENPLNGKGVVQTRSGVD